MEVCVIQSPLGSLRLSLSAKGLQRLEYLAPGSGLLPAASALSKKISQQLIAYFAGDAQTFDIPLDLIGTCYQKKGLDRATTARFWRNTELWDVSSED